MLNGGGGDDTMTGAAGLAALITTTMNGDDGNDTLTGTDGADTQRAGGNDRLVGFRGNDVWVVVMVMTRWCGTTVMAAM